jgi:hypothetical protein
LWAGRGKEGKGLEGRAMQGNGGKRYEREGKEMKGRRKGRDQRKQVTTKVQASTAYQLPLRGNGPEPGAVIVDSSRPTTKIQPFFNSSELYQIKSE